MSVYVAETEIQILYADTDMMGVIYHGSYIKWLELGRRKLIEDIGYDYLAMEREGYLAPVHNVNITYAKPLKYSDRAFVRTWVEENTGMRTIYGFEIVNGDGEVCTHGTTTLLVVKKVDGEFKPVVFKRVFPEWYAKYEEIKKK
ncbi:acyl-CoA thioesterase [Jeotgalicoccus huakuii]|jgi:acyl-CoA thioester hydrolase|uniref:acyl-CoA thioesterase n=1 Tax=Jeotgalicoccus TaxID=227979 RepID=UPI0004096D09|nr:MULTISPECIES: thioesterase family protein [Jeotgalicoccus]MCK1975927.1 acyl-CoA thioesterase [Jeotgalicoccus huakuii]QQD84789.1 acyl-CoA thioesterase [Jeotgalicoccus sp. ATCC 8456]